MDKVGEYALMVMKKATWYNSWLLSFFDKYICGDILEVGSGIGNFTVLLKKYGEATAIDVNREYNNKNKVKGVQRGFGDIEKGDYFFRDKKFDTVVCLNVIEHVENDEKAFTNIYKLLRKGGKFILLVPAHKLLYGKYDRLLGHFKRYNAGQLRSSILKSGFTIDKLRYINWWGAIGWFIFIKLLKRNDFPEKEVGIFDYFGRILLWPEKLFEFPFGLSVLLVAEK